MSTLLQINECLNSSTGKIARQIGEVAICHGWDSYIAYSAFEQYQKTQCKTFTVGSKIDYYEHALETRLFDNHGLASRLPTKKLINKIKDINPDIIHLHNVHGYYINYKILFQYLEMANIPVVWTMHDCWALTGHCSHFVTVDCDKWKLGCNHCPLINEYPKSWGLDCSRKNYNLKREIFTSVKKMVIVPVSYWLSEQLSESYLREFPVRIINNGVDLHVFKPSLKDLYLEGKSKGKIYLLGVANVWHKDKGINEFIQLSRDERFQVILVGVTPKLQKKLPNTIYTIERTNNQHELSEIYSSVDVFVNPTYADTLPTVNIEALACGTPVVTYRTGGSPEIIDQNTGFVAERGNYNQLLKGILKIGLVSCDEKETQRKLCRERALIFYDKNERFEEYIELYKTFLK